MTSDWLTLYTDVELRALVYELEEREEQFGAEVRAQVNDECRRRGVTLARQGRNRFS